MMITPRVFCATQAASKLEDLAAGRCQPVIDDPLRPIAPPGRLVLCGGKVYYELVPEAEKVGDDRPQSFGWNSSIPSRGPRCGRC